MRPGRRVVVLGLASAVSRAGGLVLLIGLLAPWLGGGQTAAAASEIGSVRHVLNYAYGTPPQRGRHPLFPQDGVEAAELVETVRDGALHIRFLDNSDLRLGSASRVRLDRFLYDSASSRGEMTVTLGQGIFRFITGKMRPEGILLVTPQALIGVRGTDFILWITAAGKLVIAVLQGEVILTPLTGGTPTILTARNTASVDSAGQVRLAVPPPPADPGLGSNPQGSDHDRGGNTSSDDGGQRG